MESNEKTLNTFATRVRQMILQYAELKKENDELYALVDQREQEIKQLQEELSQAEADYNSLKMAKMLEVTDGDMESAQKRVAKLIRLHVYDTELSVNVPCDDEEYYRSAAKLITDTVNTYSTLFKGKKGDKDIMYMAMLDIALKYKKEGVRNDTAPFNDILGKLTSEIEEVLKK